MIRAFNFEEPLSPSPNRSNGNDGTSIYPETASEALFRWDSGSPVFTVSMGGLGPGYEQAIQMLVFEIIRDHKDDALPSENSQELKAWWSAFGEKAITRTDKQAGGYTGAMVGAAKNLAYRGIRDGWAKMLKGAPQDRLIQVAKKFPQT